MAEKFELSDEVTGELMVIQDDLSGLGATLRLITDHICKQDKALAMCAEGRSLNFLTVRISAVAGDLREFIAKYGDAETNRVSGNVERSQAA